MFEPIYQEKQNEYMVKNSFKLDTHLIIYILNLT